MKTSGYAASTTSAIVLAAVVSVGLAGCAGAPGAAPTWKATSSSTSSVVAPASESVATNTEEVAAAEPTLEPSPMPIGGKTPDQDDVNQLFLIQAKAFLGPAPDEDLLKLRDSICEKLRDDPTSGRYDQLVSAASGSGSGDISAATFKKIVAGAVMSGCWDARTALPAKDLAGMQELAASGPSSSISEGVWEVGTDIKPGKYRTAEPVSDCYWAIYKGGSNGEDIIANDNVSGGRPSVTLKSGQEFKSSRCGDWRLIK